MSAHATSDLAVQLAAERRREAQRRQDEANRRAIQALRRGQHPVAAKMAKESFDKRRDAPVALGASHNDQPTWPDVGAHPSVQSSHSQRRFNQLAGDGAAMDVSEARAALRKLAPHDDRDAAHDAARAHRLMNRLAAAAASHSAGKRPLGHCLGAVQDILKGGNFPGAQVPRLPMAHDFADWLNRSPSHLKAAGLTRLKIDNPYDAPAGAIIVVRAGTPGTHHPTAGDIVISGGHGRLFNDGEMGYGGPGNFPRGNNYVLGVYVPTGASQAESPADGFTARDLSRIAPAISDSNAKRMTSVLRDALGAIGADSAEKAAGFVAAMTAGTHQFADPDSIEFIVRSAKTWRNEHLNRAASDRQLDEIANALNISTEDAEAMEVAFRRSLHAFRTGGEAFKVSGSASAIESRLGSLPSAESSSGSSGAASASDAAPASSTDSRTASEGVQSAFNDLQKGVRAYGVDESSDLLWSLFMTLVTFEAEIEAALQKDAGFAAFAKSAPGLKHWHRGDKIPRNAMAAYMAKSRGEAERTGAPAPAWMQAAGLRMNDFQDESGRLAMFGAAATTPSGSFPRMIRG